MTVINVMLDFIPDIDGELPTEDGKNDVYERCSALEPRCRSTRSYGQPASSSAATSGPTTRLAQRGTSRKNRIPSGAATTSGSAAPIVLM